MASAVTGARCLAEDAINGRCTCQLVNRVSSAPPGGRTPMARAGYRIFDADTHIIEPVEPVEAYLAAADLAKLAALGPTLRRAPAKDRKSVVRRSGWGA